MADYLEQIEAARNEVARLKGEKGTFEQSNPPDDADEEELKAWDYAKDLQRQVKELKAENRDAMRELARLVRTAAKVKATDADRTAAEKAKKALQPVFNQLEVLEAELAPYEQIKTDLAAARTQYRQLTDAFVGELKKQCAALRAQEKQDLVLELFAQDVRTWLDSAINEKRQAVVRGIENLWDKYAVPMNRLVATREQLMAQVDAALGETGYVG